MYKENHPTYYLEDEAAARNPFIHKQPECADIRPFEAIKDALPEPVWDGHEDSIEAYYRAWQIAWANLHNPSEENGFVSPYIDAAFNGDIFMWDSCLMLMFGIYANDLFPFQKTLDNFYANQLPDGFISRQIHESNGEGKFMRHDPISTGPNILGWCEWEYYLRTGDRARLEQVFAPLMAYHCWLRRNRTWQNGTYWSSGWGSGMDNQPRLRLEDAINVRQANRCFHGHMSWIDTNFQQMLSCRTLLNIIGELHLNEDAENLRDEYEYLKDFINRNMWSEREGFYFDLYRDGTRAKAKTIGAYWALLADAPDERQQNAMVSHLSNEKTFARPHSVPSLSADSEGYCAQGDYWCGGVWTPTNYMLLRGLSRIGQHDLAIRIAKNHHEHVMQVYRDTGTFWENYAPESCAPGSRSKKDFVGWTGLAPITMLIEYVLGVQLDVPNNTVRWHITNLERHGVRNLSFGSRRISLICEARASKEEPPVVHTEGCEGVKIVILA